MADLGTLVKNYLELDSKPTRLNYYTVLGIDEFLDDRTTIAVAVERAIERLKKVDRNLDPAGFEQVVKVIRQARATLLDDIKKGTYDDQLRQLLTRSAKTAATTAASPPAMGDAVRLQAVLPAGDPSAPFSMTEFLKTAVLESPHETAGERHLALSNLIDPTPAPASVPLAGWSNGASGASKASSAARELQAQIRRNRQKRSQIAWGSILGAALIGVAISGWMYLRSQRPFTETASLGTNEDRLSMAIAATTPSSNDDLDQGDATADQANATRRMNLGTGKTGSTGKVGELPKLPFDASPPATFEGDSTSGTDSSATSPPAMSEASKAPAMPVEPPVPTTPAPTDNPPSAPSPDMDDAAAASKWSASMKAARAAIDSKDFARFHREMELSLNWSRTEEHQAKRGRLDLLGQLYEKGVAAIQDGMSKTKATEVLTIGSTVANVVEIAADKVVLRVGGENKAYPIEKLPMGIVIAIANLELGDSATDKAVRGVLSFLDPRATPASKVQGKAYIEQAATEDERFKELARVFEDTY